MTKLADIIFEDNKIFVTGDIHFSNVMSVYHKSIKSLRKYSEIDLDFSRVVSSDSTGLALIVDLMKFAKQHQKKISVKNIPPNLLSIAQAAQLENLILSR